MYEDAASLLTHFIVLEWYKSCKIKQIKRNDNYRNIRC